MESEKQDDTKETAEGHVKTPADDPDAESNVQNGQVILFILAGLLLIAASNHYYRENQVEIFYINAPVIFIYLALGIFYYRNPYIASLTGLTVYLILEIVEDILVPGSFTSGILFKALIVFALFRCIKFARYYKTTEKQKDGNLLDNDLL